MGILLVVLIACVVYLACRSGEQQRQIDNLRNKGDIKSHPAYDIFD